MTAELPGFEMQQRLFTAIRAALVSVPNVTHVRRIPDAADVQTPDLSESLLVTTAEHGQFVCLVQPQLEPSQGEAQRSLNPVTFRPRQGDVVLTVGRMHVGTCLSDLQKFIPVAMWREAGHEVLAVTQLDEETLLSGLSCLFPRGELSFGAREVCQLVVDLAEKKQSDASAAELQHDWRQLVDAARAALT